MAAFRGSLQFVVDKGGKHGNEERRRVEARVCGDGPGQAAGNCKQGRQGQPRWRPQEFEQHEPLNVTSRREKRRADPIGPALC